MKKLVSMRYNHLAIEGNIGSGKTTLATMLAKEYDVRLILEKFSDNPFLPKFYKDPEKHAFPLELFFMAERYHQLKKNKQQDIFQPQKISDYFFAKSKLFAKNNLKIDEKQLFDRFFDIIFSSLENPDLVVYLYSSIDRLKKNIIKRGRSFELDISEDYLSNIQQNYLDYLRKQSLFPVLMLDVTKVDFVKDKMVYDSIKRAIDNTYSVGIHKVVL